jgi:hypothetical protein
MSSKYSKKYYIKNMFGGQNENTQQEIINEMVSELFNLQVNMKLYHWNTTSHPRHLTSDKFGLELAPLFDKFVEVYIGKYNNKPILSNNINIDTNAINDIGSKQFLENKRMWLEEFRNKINDNSLLNIYDEILGLVNQVLYLYDLS